MKTFLPVFFFLLLFHTASGQNYLGNFQTASSCIAADDAVFFVASDGVHGSELWKTDGTLSGTVMVKDISPGYDGSFIENLIVFNDEVFFSATDHIHGSELWKSDGTEEGTVMVKDILPDFDINNGSMPRNFILFDQSLFFTATDENFSEGIWKTDGTAEGTTNIYNSGYTGMNNLTVAGNCLFFVRLGTYQLWKLNAGTYFAQQIPVDEYYTIDLLTEANDKLFFITNTNYRRNIRLYTLEPSSANFTLLKSYDAVLYGDQDIDNLTEAGGNLFYSFRTDDDNGEYIDALWKSDGTVEGTTGLVNTTYDPYMTGYHMSDFFRYHNKLYFRGKLDNGYELCTSDGTPGGTSTFAGIGLAYESARFTLSGDIFYFTGYGTGSAGPVFQSDGTVEGTVECQFINNSLEGGIQSLCGNNGILYYSDNDNTTVTLRNSEPKPVIKIYRNNTLIENGNSLQFNAHEYAPVPSVALTLKNTGGRELFISESFISGRDFYISSIEKMILPGESCPFSISFFPTRIGNQEGKFVVRSNDAKYSQFVINLEGKAEVIIDSAVILDDDLVFEQKSISTGAEDTIFLDNNELDENLPAHSLVGTLNVIGYPGNDFAYSLVTGTGDADNASFSIEGNKLYASETFDFECRNTFSVRLKAHRQNEDFENYLLIRITDKNDALPGECAREFHNIAFGLNDVAYRDDQTVFAVGNDGVILRSDNDGYDWVRVNSGTKTSLLDIVFVTPQTGYITTYYDKLLKTVNGGESWFPLPAYEDTYRYIGNLYFFNETLGFVVGPDGLISRTTDGGFTWDVSRVGYDNLSAVYFINENLGFTCGRSNTLLKTTDGGENWISIDMDEFGFALPFIDMTFTGSQAGYILTQDGKVIKTTDAGQTWFEIADLSIDGPAAILFTSENTGFVVGGDVIATIYKTEDAGATWTRVSENTWGDLSGISMNPGGTHGCVVGGTWPDNGRVLYHTEDQGDTWPQLFYLDGNADYSAVKYYGEQTIYLFHDFSTLLKSADGGITWQPLPLDLASNYNEVHYLSMDTILVSDSENWHWSFDGGMTWDTIPGAPAGSHMAVISTDRMYYAHDYKIHKTEDGGQSWQEVYSGSNSIYSISCDGQGLVAALGYNLIVSSNDGGTEWHLYSDDWTASFRCVCFINGGTILAGGADGMLVRSEDAGLSWSPVRTQIQEDIREIGFTDDLYGMMRSQSRLYSTDDGGNNWEVAGYFNTEVRGMDLLENGDAWFAGEDAFISKYVRGVNPSEAGYIYGDREACMECISEYSTTVLYNERYSWEVAPAQEITWNNNYATIRWSQPGTYQLTATPDAGCGPGIPRTCTIVVNDNPGIELTGLDTVYKNQEFVRYRAWATPANLFQWQIKNEASASVLSDDEISVNWGDPPYGEVTLVHTAAATGCRSIITKKVTVLDEQSVGNIPERMDVMIFPNPATDQLHIKKTGTGGDLVITVTDIRGEQLMVINQAKYSEITVDLRTLNSGLYLLKLEDGNHNAVVKFVKL